MRILANPNFNFIRWRWHAIVFSLALVGAGVTNIIARGGPPLGVDFSGGTIMLLEFEQPIGEQPVRDVVSKVADGAVVQQSGRTGREIMVRLPLTTTVEQGVSLEEDAKRVEAAVRAAGIGSLREIRDKQIIGPVIGEDLRRKGVYATAASLVGIMTYIALRFRFSFGVGAMVASLHDVLVTLSLLTFFGYELSLNVIAAILTLTGYGVNDQIVVFDRVRENLRTNRREPMDTVINKSVNQTLPRTIITAGVTALAVLALFLFGGEVLEGFAFTMLAGIITSTYSTVYIASAVAVFLSPRRGAAPGPAGAAVPARKPAGGGASRAR
jgi:preprotein translocase subunit SecF